METIILQEKLSLMKTVLMTTIQIYALLLNNNRCKNCLPVKQVIKAKIIYFNCKHEKSGVCFLYFILLCFYIYKNL